MNTRYRSSFLWKIDSAMGNYVLQEVGIILRVSFNAKGKYPRVVVRRCSDHKRRKTDPFKDQSFNTFNDHFIFEETIGLELQHKLKLVIHSSSRFFSSFQIDRHGSFNNNKLIVNGTYKQFNFSIFFVYLK